MNFLHGIRVFDVNDVLNVCACYLLFDADGNFLYVGETGRLRDRLQEHSGRSEENERLRDIAKFFLAVPTRTHEEAKNMERVVYDRCVMLTEKPPFANNHRPPKAIL